MSTSLTLDSRLPALYAELRRLAARAMRGERAGHTLQPTALVHEAYLRLAEVEGLDASERGPFLALAARTMRHILVDHARARHATKRGGNEWMRVTLSDELAAADGAFELVSLDRALERLATIDDRQVRVFELRYVAGLSVEEVAQALAVSTASVKRDSAMAKAWLFRELGSAGTSGG